MNKVINVSLCMESQLGRWSSHFQQVLNIESTYSDSVFETLQHRPVNHDLANLPSSSELSRSIRSLASGKAPGVSGILPEMLKFS